MTKAYTKKGDTGTTGLFDGSRIQKTSTDALLLSLGKLDSLNVEIGALKYSLKSVDEYFTKDLEQLQNINMDLMGHFQSPEMIEFNEDDILQNLEEKIDMMHKQLPTLTKFIIPGETEHDIFAHRCRVQVRESELYFNEYLVAHEQSAKYTRILGGNSEIDVNIKGKKYLNRLSSYFFTLARFINHIYHDSSDNKHFRLQ